MAWLDHDDAEAAIHSKLPQDLPTGSLASTIPRHAINSNGFSGTSGTMRGALIYLRADLVVSSIIIPISTTGGASLTHSMAGLYSADQTSPALLRGSSDDTTATWTASTARTFTLTSSYTVPTSGFYYVMFFVTGTTMPSLHINAHTGTGVAGRAPITGLITSNTGLTTSLPNPATISSTNQNWAYIEVA